MKIQLLWSVVFGFLVTGAAARVLYPGRQPANILGTLLLGVAGALAGGIVSWSLWTTAEYEFHAGNLVLAFMGAAAAIMIWAIVAYGRTISGIKRTAP